MNPKLTHNFTILLTRFHIIAINLHSWSIACVLDLLLVKLYEHTLDFK